MGHTTRASFTSITPRQIRVIGVPLDLGQSRCGVDMGPSAVRVAGLEARLEAIGHKVEDAGNIAVAIPEQSTIRRCCGTRGSTFCSETALE